MTKLELKEPVNRIGELADVIEQFQPGTIQEAADVMEERRTLPEKEGVAGKVSDGDLFWSESFPLATNHVWTGNFAMYTHEGGEAFLYLGGNEANPLFNTERVREHREAARRSPGRVIHVTNIPGKALEPTEEEGEGAYIHYAGDDFRPTQADIDAVLASVESGSTLRVKLSDFRLLDIGANDGKPKTTFKYGQTLNAAEGALTERVYGSGKACLGIMLERPGYVRKEVKDAGKGKPTDAIVRACSLQPEILDQGFNADEWVLAKEYLMRGIPVVTEQGQKRIQEAYGILLECPASSAAVMGPEAAYRVTKLLAKAQQYNPALNASPESISPLPGMIHPERQSEVEKAYDILLKVPEASAKLITPEQFHAVSSMREAIRAWQNW